MRMEGSSGPMAHELEIQRRHGPAVAGSTGTAGPGTLSGFRSVASVDFRVQAAFETKVGPWAGLAANSTWHLGAWLHPGAKRVRPRGDAGLWACMGHSAQRAGNRSNRNDNMTFYIEV
jgi:hypothetical protein